MGSGSLVFITLLLCNFPAAKEDAGKQQELVTHANNETGVYQNDTMNVKEENSTDVHNFCASLPGDVSRRLCYMQLAYVPAHGHVAAVICSVGVISNVLSISVLTRPRLRTPTNILLCFLAFCDGLTTAAYLGYNILFYLKPAEYQSYGQTLYLLVYLNIGGAVYMNSMGCTVAVAVLRVLLINGHIHVGNSRQMAYTALGLSMSTTMLPILTSFLAHRMTETSSSEWRVELSPNGLFVNMNYWLQALLRIGACISLIPMVTYITGHLQARRVGVPCEPASSVQHAKRTSSSTEGDPRANTAPVKNRTTGPAASSSRFIKDQVVTAQYRTTRLLFVLLIVFLVTNMPHGILIVLAGVLGNSFFLHIYTPLREILDLLTLINCSVNFFIYCLFSHHFWHTLKEAARKLLPRCAKVGDGFPPANMYALTSFSAKIAKTYNKSSSDPGAHINELEQNELLPTPH